MKKVSIFVLVLVSIFFLAGCEKQEVVESNGEEINVTKMEHKHCTRTGTATGADVYLNYDIYYTGDILNILKSEEKIVSSSSETLTTYEEAYKKIHSNYEGLEYYDAEVVRGDTAVTSTITINYDKININSLIAIEGEEDNIFENGQAKVDKWLELAKKFGTKCEVVTDENSEE